ncbi:tetraacyldisaccharide 4'-kinase [Pseudoalteromonas sp. T1lg65]|uniref:tetraacyldisaccharide 4'-kinase n=1 Tax=Pseudoalteromonas sp. T1lg65 TaxID=2077101 RepID=UPI003F79D13B
MSNRIEQTWYRKPSLLTALLLPFSGVFWLISVLRRYLYQIGVLSNYRAPVPVIIVGNIGVGGNGKTPFVLWLVPYLQSLGLKVAVISRGYGAKPPHSPFLVEKSTSPQVGGDEPCLLAQRLDCSVVIGSDRKASIEYLLANDDIDIIVSDDGLQHYKLARDIELCIVDAQRNFGNGFVLPAGPLRELPKRLNTVDLCVYNGGQSAFSYQLKVDGFFRVSNDQPVQRVDGEGIAVCAIGNPRRFEQSLTQQGIQITNSAHFVDHHKYSESDFARWHAQSVFMTEKDAVKCRAFAKDNWYYLKVSAEPTAELQHAILELLKNKEIIHGI